MFWFGVAVIAVGLLISIALHEIGHLLPAKLFGVKVPQYFVGFGKTLWSTRRGETEYGIKALPLGGFVRMIGMFPPAATSTGRRRGIRGWMRSVAQDARTYSADEVPDGEEHRAFYSLSVPKKLAVMFGGPVVNLIIAAVLFAIVVSGFGTPEVTNRIASVSDCVESAESASSGESADSGQCASGDPSPAAEAGLEPGDAITSWNGTPVSDWDELVTLIEAGGQSAAEVTIEREGSEFTTNLTPQVTEREVVEDGEVLTDADGAPKLESAPVIGIGGSFELIPQPLSQVPAVVGEVFTGTAQVVLQLPQRLYAITTAVFTDSERDPGVMGIIGAGRVAGQIASTPADQYGGKERASDLLSLIGSLNMALFVFNMIPLLPLDGGHIAGALYEGARRKWAGLRRRPDPGRVDTARLMPLTYVVFTLLLGMSLLLAFADIVKPVTL